MTYINKTSKIRAIALGAALLGVDPLLAQPFPGGGFKAENNFVVTHQNPPSTHIDYSGDWQRAAARAFKDHARNIPNERFVLKNASGGAEHVLNLTRREPNGSAGCGIFDYSGKAVENAQFVDIKGTAQICTDTVIRFRP